eukprot:1071557-Pyramimonas_sp.AAC.1
MRQPTRASRTVFANATQRIRERDVQRHSHVTNRDRKCDAVGRTSEGLLPRTMFVEQLALDR